MPIFVFGSNRAGRHGKGDALVARRLHGAVYGQGEGLQGQSYGVPTKDEWLCSLPLTSIAVGVRRFLQFAAAHPELQFDIACIGCGLAGYTPAEVAPLFAGSPPNCRFNDAFAERLEGLGERPERVPDGKGQDLGPAQGSLAF